MTYNPHLVTKINNSNRLGRGYYTNGIDLRWVEKIELLGEKILPTSKLWWRKNGPAVPGTKKGNIASTVKAFTTWVNKRPKDFPQLVYANELSKIGGLYFVEKPLECIWDNNAFVWGSLDFPELSVGKLGITSVGGPVKFASTSEREVRIWMAGVASLARVSRTFFDFGRLGKLKDV